MFGLPAAGPEADRLYGNAALVPLGTAQQRVSITEPVAPSPAQSEEANSDANAAAAEATQAVAAANDGKSFTRDSLFGRLKGWKSVSDDVLRTQLVDEHKQALGQIFAEQRSAALSGASNFVSWDPRLESVLLSLARATTDTFGARTASQLGGRWTGSTIQAWLEKNAHDVAQRIDAATADRLAEILDNLEPGEDTTAAINTLFDGEVAARQDEISTSRVTMLSAFAGIIAASDSGATSKTWVAGSNPRPDHAGMDGETVGINDKFSNGANGPGDYAAGASESANCNCHLIFGKD